MKIVYLNVVEKKAPAVMDIEITPRSLQKWIRSKKIKMAERSFLGDKYTVFYDNDYYHKEPIISAYFVNGSFPLIGNLIVAGKRGENGIISNLTEKDIDRILSVCILSKGYYFFSLR